jgi:hypothetical protein
MGFRAVRGCWLLRPGLRLGSLGAEREGAPTGARAERAHLSNSRIDGRTDRDRKKSEAAAEILGRTQNLRKKKKTGEDKKRGEIFSAASSRFSALLFFLHKVAFCCAAAAARLRGSVIASDASGAT